LPRALALSGADRRIPFATLLRKPMTILRIRFVRALALSLVLAAAAVQLPIAFATSAAAHEFMSGTIAIMHPWIRQPPPSSSTAAGYLSITNTGPSADTLLSVESETLGNSVLHTSLTNGGVVEMQTLEGGLKIEPGATAEMTPKGVHFMFTGLSQVFRVGQLIPADLIFEKAGRVRVAFKIEPISFAPAGTAQQSMDH
jgi:copper(I)-binding protein